MCLLNVLLFCRLCLFNLMGLHFQCEVYLIFVEYLQELHHLLCVMHRKRLVILCDVDPNGAHTFFIKL